MRTEKDARKANIAGGQGRTGADVYETACIAGACILAIVAATAAVWIVMVRGF